MLSGAKIYRSANAVTNRMKAQGLEHVHSKCRDTFRATTKHCQPLLHSNTQVVRGNAKRCPHHVHCRYLAFVRFNRELHFDACNEEFSWSIVGWSRRSYRSIHDDCSFLSTDNCNYTLAKISSVNLRFSQRLVRRWLSSGILRRVVW